MPELDRYVSAGDNVVWREDDQIRASTRVTSEGKRASVRGKFHAWDTLSDAPVVPHPGVAIERLGNSETPFSDTPVDKRCSTCVQALGLQ